MRIVSIGSKSNYLENLKRERERGIQRESKGVIKL